MIGKYPANRLRSLRRAKDLSQARLAEACFPPTTAPTIEKLENGKMELTLSWMLRLAAALKIHPGDLIIPPAGLAEAQPPAA